LEVEAFPIEEQGAQFELAMEILDSETQLTAVLKFNTDLYSTCSAQKLLAHYRNTLSAMLEGPSNPVKRLSILDDAEEQRLINDSDQTQTDFPENACIHQLFEQQVSKLSDKVAVSLDGRTLTYKQLDQRSNQLAAFLIEQGVEPDSLVGLCCERSFEMIIGILGIMKAGGAYVPLDPDYPLTRLEYLLEDSGTDIVLAQSHLAGQLPIRDHQLFILNDELTKNYGSEKSALRKELRSTHLAYMIYTSGSTGVPKGVMVEHQALVNRLDWMKNHYQFDHNDRILQKTPYSFDVSVWELLLPLITGAMLVFSRPDGHKDADYLSNLITLE
jgi:non-ribosomal peptide synthetase component F